MSRLPSTQRIVGESASRVDDDDDIRRGCLLVNGNRYRIAIGETKIGRDASECSIVIDDETLSKVHAVIESEGFEDSFIYDAGSTNKTKIGKMVLKPHCRYKINENDVILLGNVSIKYTCFGAVDKGPASSVPEKDVSVKSICLNKDAIFGHKEESASKGRCGGRLLSAFESPSSPLLLQPINRQDKRQYYLAVDEPYASDIFSQATQCVVSDGPRKEMEAARFADVDDVSDILNASTQCVTPGKSLAGVSKPPSLDISTNAVDFGRRFSEARKESNRLAEERTRKNSTAKIPSDDDDDALCELMSIHSPSVSVFGDSPLPSPSAGTREKPGRTNAVDGLDEDMISTQIFGSRGHKSGAGNRDSQEGRRQLEDAVATQIFGQSSGRRGAEDDIPTQAFPGSRERVEDDVATQLLCEGVANAEAAIADSGDETELESDVVRDGRERGGRESECSDKTESDLDVMELRGNADEDFIATQIFPAARKLKEESRGSDAEDLIATQVFPSPDDGEDFIATQLLPAEVARRGGRDEELSPTLLPSQSAIDAYLEVNEEAGEGSRKSPTVVCDSDGTDCEEAIETGGGGEGGRSPSMLSPRRRLPDWELSLELTSSTQEFQRYLNEALDGGSAAKESPKKRSIPRRPEAVPKKKSKTAGKKSEDRLMTEIDLKNIIYPEQGAAEGVVAPSSRRRSAGRRARKVTNVAFTGFESEAHSGIIGKLGGRRVNDVRECHVLVTDRVKRTVKLLSAVAMGVPVVSPKWLTASDADSAFLDPWDFLLRDPEAESKWQFNLRAALEKAKKRKLLAGYSVHATESTRPPVRDMLDIVACCGGNPLDARPDETWPEKSIVLTCAEDREFWPPKKQRHVKVVHYEFLLSGVLQHFLDFKTYKLR